MVRTSLKVALGLILLFSLLLVATQGVAPIVAFFQGIADVLIGYATSVGAIGIFIFTTIVFMPAFPLVAPEYIFPVYIGAGYTAPLILLYAVAGAALWMAIGYFIGRKYSNKFNVEDNRFMNYLNKYGFIVITFLMVFPILPIPIEFASGIAALDWKKYMLASVIGAFIRFSAVLGLMGAGMQAVAFNARPYGI